MRQLLSSVAWRYAALGAQFLIVVLVARRASLETAGSYFTIFSLTVVTCVLAGLGLPEGLVVYLSAAAHTTKAISSACLRAVSTSASSAFVGAMLVGLWASYSGFGTVESITIGTWWLLYSIITTIAQTLVAIKEAAWGSFAFYSAANLAYLITVVPYAALSDRPSLGGLLLSAAIGTFLAASLLVAVLIRKIHTLPEGDDQPESTDTATAGSFTTAAPLSSIARIGLPILVTRLLQSSIPWIPTWLFSAVAQVDDAAISAAASRLVVIVTSVLASLRFASRPQLGALMSRREYGAVVRLSRRSSLAAAAAAAGAIIFLGAAGSQALPLLLGADYAAVTPTLMVLSVSVLAEAIGGLSDEILKMSGHANIALLTLVAGISAQVALSTALLPGGPAAVAAATAVGFVIQYSWQVYWLGRNLNLRLWAR